MALKQVFETETGINLPECYVRVVRVELDMLGPTATITARRYADQAARDAGAAHLSADEFYLEVPTHDPEGPVLDYDTWFGDDALAARGATPFSRAYALLKTLPEFSNAEDALEDVGAQPK